jgi:hypothetical protein
MRLIDADELKKAFEDCTGDCACCVHNTNDFEYCGLIDNAPTVDAIPYSVHEKAMDKTINELFEVQEELNKIRNGTGGQKGEWIKKYSDYGVYYRCSNCHKMPPNYECDYKEGAIKTNFCPNCGADMRGNKE